MTKYVVECADYTTRPLRSESDAQHRLDAIVKTGVCPHPHVIRPADRKDHDRS